MKEMLLLLLLNLAGKSLLFGQYHQARDRQRKAISSLIDQYAQARETRDTVLLKTILTPDVDQLVSTGEWRNGIDASVQGMLKSSASNSGTRTLTVEKIRLFDQKSAIVDCRYEIQSNDSITRKMWSTFIVVSTKNLWKISAIRNMLPSE